tara:strand:- start:30 stop:197 length:168 start_codon:yes stop_codon:yes gene_type:complete
LKDPVAFHHVAYSTKDLGATHHFYEGVFGFPLVNAELNDQEEAARVLAAPIGKSA